MRELSVIVPCYNEEKVVPLFYQELHKVLITIEMEYEILFIDDGSEDKTLDEILKLSSQDSNVKYISFSRNFGKEAAMYAGFCNAAGDYVAVMDADLQDPPALLPQMLDKIINEGYDSVATRRVTRAGEPVIRSFFARMFYRIMNRITDFDVVDGARDFRLMTRPMVNAIVSMGEYNRFSKGIFSWIGFKTYWIPYENVERVAGETKWSFWGLVRYALDGIINFSEAPLRIASWLGMIMVIISVAAVTFVVIRRLIFGDPVAGWASLVCIIIFIGGVQLFCLGVIGEYLAKTYLETKHRPIYIIGKSNFDGAK